MKHFILIDRSGSMHGRMDETLGAVNGYVAKLIEEKAKRTDITTVAFDSVEPYKTIRDSVKLANWINITTDEASPRGGTPLFDAIGSLAQRITELNPKKATIIILTDGMENGSQEVKKETAKSYLDELRAKGYDVVFIGADFDSFSQSAGLGGGFGQTISMKSGSYEMAFASLATRSMNYAKTGLVAEFTDEDRKAAAGVK